MSNEAKSVGQTSRASNEQLTEQTKAHGRFGKRHIAAIAIGTAIALGGIAATIATGGAFAAGAIGATLFGALFATAGTGALSGILIMTSGIQKGLESRKAEISKPQQKTDQKLIVKEVEKKEQATSNKPSSLIGILQSEPTELAKNIKGTMLAPKECQYNFDEIIKKPEILLQEPYISLKAITDIKRTRNTTITINNTHIKYSDAKYKDTNSGKNSGFITFITDVLTACKGKETKTLFLKQYLIYPAQRTTGAVSTTYATDLMYKLPEQGIASKQCCNTQINISFDGNNMTAQYKITNVLVEDNITGDFQNKECFSEEVTVSIGKDDKQFKLTKYDIKTFTATGKITEGGWSAQLSKTTEANPTSTMTYTGAQGNQPPTFTITKPDESKDTMKTVKTLRWSRKWGIGRHKWRPIN